MSKEEMERLQFSDEQKMIVETVKKFKEKECPKEKVREWDLRRHFSKSKS